MTEVFKRYQSYPVNVIWLNLCTKIFKKMFLRSVLEINAIKSFWKYTLKTKGFGKAKF